MQDQMGVLVEAIRVTVLELHEILQVEGKQHFDPNSYYECRLNLGKFFR